MNIVATGVPATLEDYQVALNAVFEGGKAMGKAMAEAQPSYGAHWSVFNTGACVADGLTMEEAKEYMTPERIARGWTSVYCVVVKSDDEWPAAKQEQGEPVALDVILDFDEAKILYDQFGDDREYLSPVRLIVGDGHSGYGLYAAQAEYQDEGAVLIASITPPAALAKQEQGEPVAWTLTETLEKKETTTTGRLWFSNPQNSSWTPLYTTPQQRKPLTDEQIKRLIVEFGKEFNDFDSLPEVCLLVSYDPEVGSIPERWEPKWHVFQAVRYVLHAVCGIKGEV
jgi:hypothetical protein